jgi:hypothetical protein
MGKAHGSAAKRLLKSWRVLMLFAPGLPSTKTSIPFLIDRYLDVRLLSVSNGADSAPALQRLQSFEGAVQFDTILAINAVNR